jgi:hypothetical protein
MSDQGNKQGFFGQLKGQVSSGLNGKQTLRARVLFYIFDW